MGSGRKFIKYWLPVILWMCLIFWMSTGTFAFENTASFVNPVLRFLLPEMPPKHMDLIHALIRKAGHVTGYFILSLLLFRALVRSTGQSLNRWRVSRIFAGSRVIFIGVPNPRQRACGTWRAWESKQLLTFAHFIPITIRLERPGLDVKPFI